MRNVSTEDADFYKTSKFDIALVILILFFSIGSLLWLAHKHNQESSQAKIALIYVGDKLLEEVDLTKDKVISLGNEQMQIEVKENKVRVLKANCPHHICMNMGWIQYDGQTIACVPNKVLIEIKTTGSQLLDAVSY